MEELEQSSVKDDFENYYQWKMKSGLQQEQVIATTVVTTDVAIASSFNEMPSMTAVISEEMIECSHWKVVKSHCSNDAVASIERKMQQNFDLRGSCQSANSCCLRRFQMCLGSMYQTESSATASSVAIKVVAIEKL
jgi:hypothetical protein